MKRQERVGIKMGIEYKVGFVIGALIGTLIWCAFILVFLKLTRTDGSLKSKYDERQKIVQGKAFKYGFFVLMAYNFLMGILGSCFAIQYADMGTEMILGVIISATITMAYMIWNDGYFSLNENIARMFVGFAALVLINIGIGIYNLRFGGIVENGMLTFHSLSFFGGLMVFAIMIIAGVKYIFNKKSEEE